MKIYRATIVFTAPHLDLKETRVIEQLLDDLLVNISVSDIKVEHVDDSEPEEE